MFEVDLRVNGRLVGQLRCRNLRSEGEQDRYEFEYDALVTGDGDRGEILHRRADGLRTLVAAILQRVDAVDDPDAWRHARSPAALRGSVTEHLGPLAPVSEDDRESIG